MPKRTIKTGLATYVNAKGVAGCYGFQGEEVDVHPDDVERFDELNEQPGGDEPHDPGYVPMSMVTSPGAANAGNASGLNTVVEVDDEGNPVDDSTAEEDAKAAAKEDAKEAKAAERESAKSERESAKDSGARGPGRPRTTSR